MRASRQELQPPLEPLEERGRWKHLDPGGGELDRERQVIEPPADLTSLAVARDLDTRGSDPLEEEGDGVRLTQRQDDVLAFSGEMKRLSARHEQAEVGTGSQELGELGRGCYDVLEVVEQEEQALRADVLGEFLGGAENLGDRCGDKRGLAKHGETDPEDAVRIKLGDVGGGLRREPGLAGTSCPSQSQQPRLVVREQRAHLLQLALTPKEGCRRHRQIRLVERGERRKLFLAELVQALRRRQVLQPVQSEVAK